MLEPARGQAATLNSRTGARVQRRSPAKLQPYSDVAAGILPAVEPGVSPSGIAVHLARMLQVSSAGPGGRMPAATRWRCPDAPGARRLPISAFSFQHFSLSPLVPFQLSAFQCFSFSPCPFPSQPRHGMRIIHSCSIPSKFCPLRIPNYFWTWAPVSGSHRCWSIQSGGK